MAIARVQIGGFDMTGKWLRYGAVLLALSWSAGAQAQSWGSTFNDFRQCPPDTHSQSFPNGQGYRCVPDR
jgi:hypothetical protein